VFARGSIFLDENFQFRDGAKRRKLLILLNNPAQNDPYFLVKTTSQQHQKPKKQGCIEHPYHKAYFIQGNSGDFFKIDTWIQLDDYFPFDHNTVKRELKLIGNLSEKITTLLIDCFRKINEQDLSLKMLDYLFPKIEQGISALVNKFNKR
jgi:hypothetical protein